jgi:hypothetical protein
MYAKRIFTTLAVVALLAVAVLYNGHAGLGSNAAVTDGTSNTLQIGALILMADMGGQ